MRAVFTIDLPKARQATRTSDGENIATSSSYPTNLSIVHLVKEFGWELQNMYRLSDSEIRAIATSQGTSYRESQTRSDLNNQALTPAVTDVQNQGSPLPITNPTLVAGADRENTTEDYKRLANELFAEMPEVAAAEKEYVVFAGYIADLQTPFVITRMVQGQMTFRLLHRELPRLQLSTEKMLRNIIDAKLEGSSLKISNPRVTVFERRYDHIIITGRVITNAIGETIRSDVKDFILFLVPLILFLITIYALVTLPTSNPPTLGHGILERANTAFLTTTVISLLSLIQVYVEIRRSRLIDWTVPRAGNRQS
jgi:hypothetical protein